MGLSPASFRRRIAYDVINDYVLTSLHKDSGSLHERQARAMLLPAFTLSILARLRAREERIRDAIKSCIEAYRNKLGYDIPTLDENMSVEDWYMKCIEKKEQETIDDWIIRVALCSHCILSYACLEEAVVPAGPEFLY